MLHRGAIGHGYFGVTHVNQVLSQSRFRFHVDNDQLVGPVVDEELLDVPRRMMLDDDVVKGLHEMLIKCSQKVTNVQSTRTHLNFITVESLFKPPQKELIGVRHGSVKQIMYFDVL